MATHFHQALIVQNLWPCIPPWLGSQEEETQKQEYEKQAKWLIGLEGLSEVGKSSPECIMLMYKVTGEEI